MVMIVYQFILFLITTLTPSRRRRCGFSYFSSIFYFFTVTCFTRLIQIGVTTGIFSSIKSKGVCGEKLLTFITFSQSIFFPFNFNIYYFPLLRRRSPCPSCFSNMKIIFQFYCRFSVYPPSHLCSDSKNSSLP